MDDKKQTTTVSVYAEDAAALRDIKLDDQKQADQLAAIVHDYFKRREMTHGQSVAADTVALIQVQTAKLCELVENAAQVAADESKAVVEQANGQVEAVKAALEDERTAHKAEVDELKSQLTVAAADAAKLPAALGQIESLTQKLDAADAAKAKAEDAKDTALADANAAKALASDVQTELTKALNAKADAVNRAAQLDAQLTKVTADAQLAAVQAQGEINELKAKLDAAEDRNQQATGKIGYLEDQIEDLRKQADDLRRQLAERYHME